MVFSEISIDRLADYASLFPGRQLALLRQSVSAGNTLARLWVTSGVGTADTAVLWDFGNKGLYVGGDCSSNCSRDALRSLVREELAAVAHAAGLKFCSVRAVSPDVVAAVNDAFADSITVSCRKLFHEHPLVVRTIAGGLAPDVEFVNSDRRLLDAGTVNGEQVAEEVRWTASRRKDGESLRQSVASWSVGALQNTSGHCSAALESRRQPRTRTRASGPPQPPASLTRPSDAAGILAGSAIPKAKPPFVLRKSSASL